MIRTIVIILLAYIAACMIFLPILCIALRRQSEWQAIRDYLNDRNH